MSEAVLAKEERRSAVPPNNANWIAAKNKLDRLVGGNLEDGAVRWTLKLKNDTRSFRLRVAAGPVNQVRLRDEMTYVVYAPPFDQWYVLDFRWLVRYAAAHPQGQQHAISSIECFMLSQRQLPAHVAPHLLATRIRAANAQFSLAPVVKACKGLKAARQNAENQLTIDANSVAQQI